MATKKTTLGPDELIALIIQRAPQLLAAGVTSMTLTADGGCSVTLAPPPQKFDALPKPKEMPKQHIDPLKDSATFPGGRIPGYTREEDTFR